ncbi:transketolase C-terminal domain-containing protein [Spirochaeta isovalerica]|uniref:Pyruvate ferredoxin oxidoreductase alpha subunit n=1 Tax=Spirochaeta isovalerica TaxID=150 RepID=A0A841RCX6_9SPIO|nr:transketolase C-terminal domain-containing protein [Spirochaeta isovalerica]MBB6480709.1 pyruvate ferredoxin oxidoreductase alpha subunit [Spirochaeta isovalerica]
MSEFAFLNGNEAVAWGVRLSRPHVIAAYPITPQTKAVEKLSSFVQNGEMDCKYLHVESEHSAMACSIGSSSVGARTFTATSSQGLLYMSEGLPYASGARLPIVMMNANRSIATPWNIYGDQMDAMHVINSGWVQLFVEDAQEALDMVIQSFKLAENHDILTPVMINVDGFVLTHTYEKVDIPGQELVDSFLPAIEKAPHLMNDQDPMSLCISAGNQHYMEFKIKQHRDMFKVFEQLERIDRDFEKSFGRSHGGAADGYRNEDADVILVTTGSVTGTARVVVDSLREKGIKAGLVKLRLLRPFPSDDLYELIGKASAVGILDKNISFGFEGTVYTNVNSSLLQKGYRGRTFNFIAGLGGRDITKENIEEMFSALLEQKGETVQYFNMGCAL